jgi:hypothetical protein
MNMYRKIGMSINTKTDIDMDVDMNNVMSMNMDITLGMNIFWTGKFGHTVIM